MSTAPVDVQDKQSFAETALRLGGKSEEEVQRMGAVDKADEQVETLYTERLRTANSPVHRAVWDGHTPLDLFMPPPVPEGGHCETAMHHCLDLVRRRVADHTIYDANGKISQDTIDELSRAGYWGMLIDREHGGQGATFAEYVRFHTRMATVENWVAGMSSVHGCIGAVDPLRAFGTREQKERFLPRLANGDAISAFALTEPGAGSDLTALRTTAVEVGDELEITGEKLFITNVEPGRTIGLVLLLNKEPTVVIADLPPHENEHFQLVRYKLHALKHGVNYGIKFNRFRVPRANLLKTSQGNGLTIAYHGLNLGRVTLCASASASMRVMLASMLPWAQFRRTYGQVIATRELVKRRIARLAGLIAGADAMTAWCSWLLDEGYRGELECIVAKIFGSEALKEAAVELLMKTHGGRSFVGGHIFGENIHDFLAPCIYEGEGEMLGMAFFKSLVKEHGKRFFEPIGKTMAAKQMKTFKPWNPAHLWALRGPLWRYSKWSMGRKFTRRDRQSVTGMDRRLAEHVDFALEQFQRHPKELSNAMKKHQLKLADRQCRMSELSSRIQDTVVMLVTALWGGGQKHEAGIAAADILCRDLRRKLTGERPNDRYFRDVSKLADVILSGGYEALAEITPEAILMPYEQK